MEKLDCAPGLTMVVNRRGKRGGPCLYLSRGAQVEDEMASSSINIRGQQSRKITRRHILCRVGAGAGAVLGGTLSASGRCKDEQIMLEGRCKDEQIMLERGDRVEIDGEADHIIQRAYELGHQYEKEHGGCARCTVAALQDAVPFVAVDVGLFRGATCLDGGATPTGTQNCGAFTGTGMVIGHLCGSTRDETFKGSAKLAHELLHKVYYRFKDEYGTVLCKDVRKGVEGNCPEAVGRAAKWAAEVILEEFTGYTPPEKPKEQEADEPDEKRDEK